MRSKIFIYAKQIPNQHYAKAYSESVQEEMSTTHAIEDSMKKKKQHKFSHWIAKLEFSSPKKRKNNPNLARTISPMS